MNLRLQFGMVLPAAWNFWLLMSVMVPSSRIGVLNGRNGHRRVNEW